MSRAVPLIALVALLSGCLGTRTVTAVETVEVPVPVSVSCPVPPSTSRPALAIEALGAGASAADVARAYVATVVALQAYARRLELLLDAYRAPADTTLRSDG